MCIIDTAPGDHYVGDGGSQELEAARALGMQAVQAVWYRQTAFEHKQAALRPDFVQIAEPRALLPQSPK